MRILRHQGVVAAPREQVFAIVEDARQADRLNPDFLRIAVEKAPWIPGPGKQTSFGLVYRGASFSLTTEVAEHRRGHFLLERQVDGPFASFEHAINLADSDDGTAVTEILAYSVRLGLLGRLFDRVTLSKDLDRLLRIRHARLKSLLELG